MISVRWRPSSWMQFSSLSLKSSMTRPKTEDRSDEFPDGWLPSNHSTYEVSERKHAISNTPKEKKSHVERSGERGGHGTSPKREIMCPGNMFRTMVIDSFAVCAVAPLLLKWPTQRKRMPTTSPPPRPTYWVLPIQKMSGSRGSSCTILTSWCWAHWKHVETYNKLIIKQEFVH